MSNMCTTNACTDLTYKPRSPCYSTTVEPDQNCTIPLVKNGKIGNTSCVIGNLNIIGFILCYRRTFVKVIQIVCSVGKM